MQVQQEVESSKDLKKSLGLFDAIAIVSGSMIGSGIFIVSSDIARQVGSPWLLMLVWLVAGLLTVSAGLCYGELAATWPHAGGQYVYLKNIWGKTVGFIYGWTLFLVIQTGTIAAVAVAFAKFLSLLFPVINSSSLLFHWGFIKISILQIVAVSLIAGLTFVNTRGVKTASVIQNVFTITKIAALLGIIFCGLFLFKDSSIFSHNFSQVIPVLDKNIYSLVAVALVGALFSSDAWNNVTFIAAEIKNTSKNLPLSLILGIGSVILLYLLINVAYLHVLPMIQIMNVPNDMVAAALMKSIFGGSGAVIISIIVLIATFGCVNGIILSGARVYYAMAKDGLFFKKLAQLGKKSNVPENSLILQGIWSILLVLSGSYSQLLDYVIFAAIIFYIMTIGGVLIARKKYPDIERPYKVMFYPYLPILYCIVSLFIAVNLLIYKPDYTWPGLLIVLSGFPVYWFWKKSK